MALIVSLLALAAVAAVTILAGRTDQPDDVEIGATAPPSLEIDYERELADAKGSLADLYARGDVLLDGGRERYRAELAALEGNPVVVNAWGSWCDPCRSELPIFQRASAELGHRVGFLGVDTNEISKQAGEGFLAEYPVPYPSVYDDGWEIVTDEWRARTGLPATAFYRASGELAHVKYGEYTSVDELESDIERYTR